MFSSGERMVGSVYDFVCDEAFQASPQAGIGLLLFQKDQQAAHVLSHSVLEKHVKQSTGLVDLASRRWNTSGLLDCAEHNGLRC